MTPPAAEAHATAEQLLAQTGWLRRLASSLVGSGSDAEDLCQDAIVAALEQRPRAASLRPFLRTVLRRLSAQRWRGERRRRERELAAARPEALPATADLVAHVALQRQVVDAVLALREPWRSALLLRFFDELSPPQIGVRLHAPAETVRTWQKRGLAEVRARLDRAHGGKRRAWVAPLAAFARPRPVATLTPVAAGMLIVATKTKILTLAGVAAVAAIALALLVLQFASHEPEVTPTNVSPPLAAALPPQEPSPSRVAAAAPRVASSPPAAGPRLVVTGSLVDEETLAPIGGADVRLAETAWPEQREPAAEPSTTSATDGTFRLEDRRAEAPQPFAELLVRAPGKALLFVRGFREQDTGTVDVGRVLVPAGTRFAGRVVTAGGAPVPGAAVLVSRHYVAFDPSTAHVQDVLSSCWPLTTSGADGRFESAMRYAPESLQHLLVAVADGGIGYLEVPITRNRRDVLDVEVRLRPTATVHVTVRSREGTPLAGAAVRAEPRFAPFGHRGSGSVALGQRPDVLALFETRSDARGEATLSRLPLGEGGTWNDGSVYDLVVAAGGHRPRREPGVHLDPALATRREIVLAPDIGVALHGVVRTPEGAPAVPRSACSIVARRATPTGATGSRISAPPTASCTWAPRHRGTPSSPARSTCRRSPTRWSTTSR